MVEPPADLHELDLGVREQFAQLWNEPGRDLPQPPDERRNWGALGQWFHVYRYSESAARCYRNAIVTDSANPRWPYLLGVLVAETGQSEVAMGYFEAALALAPEALPAQARLADLARQMGDLAQAQRRYREVLAQKPEDVQARFGLAQLLLQKGDSAAALALLLQLAAEQPDASELNYALGTAWRLSGDEARAAVALAQVPKANVDQIALRLDDPWMTELRRTDQGSRQLTRKGIQAANRGLTGRAAELFGAAVRLDPKGPEERINYALALSRLRHHSEALEQIRQAIQLATADTDTHVRARLEEARLLAQSGRPGQAESKLQVLLADRPNDDAARVELSRLLHTRGALEPALAEYSALREHGASGSELAFWQAAALLGLGRLDAARAQLVADLALYPDDQSLRLLWIRSLATATAVRAEDAVQARLWLAQMDPPISVLRGETAAMLHASGAEYDLALTWQQAVVDTLIAAGRSRALQTARRRLTLYREHKPVATPWEATERPVDAVVIDPYAAPPVNP